MYSPRERSSRSSEPHEEDEEIYESQSSTTTYRSILSPRITNVQRSRPSGLITRNVTTRMRHTDSSTGMARNFGPGLAALVHNPAVPLRGSSNGVTTAIVSINNTRQREKHELNDLNDKFAQYVEKVRYLEAHNRKLLMEIDALQTRLRQGSSRIKEMYDIEMNEATKLIDETRRDAANSNIQQQRAEKDLRDQTARYNRIKNLRETDRREIDALQLQISENEAQIALFRRRLADIDDEARRYKTEAQRLAAEITGLQNDIQNEVFLRSTCDVEKIGVEDEITNLRQLHEADLAELRSKSVTNDLDPSQFFRNELAEAIREIRNDYETSLANRRTDLQNRYSVTINEITIRVQQNDANPLYTDQQRRQVENRRNELVQAQNQNNSLRNKNREMQDAITNLKQQIQFLRENELAARNKAKRDIDDAHRRLERVEREYAETTVYRTSLEKEIATYRELLEGPSGLRRCADRIVQNVEQKALERPTTNPNYRFDTNRSTTTMKTVEHTYINTERSNYDYSDQRTSSPIRRTGTSSPITPSMESSSYRQEPSVISRIIPVYDETTRHSSSSDSTIRGEEYQRSNVQDSPPRNNPNRGNLIRERTPSPVPSSSSSSSTSSSSGEEDQTASSANRNGANNHHYPPPSTADYEIPNEESHSF